MHEYKPHNGTWYIYGTTLKLQGTDAVWRRLSVATGSTKCCYYKCTPYVVSKLPINKF